MKTITYESHLNNLQLKNTNNYNPVKFPFVPLYNHLIAIKLKEKNQIYLIEEKSASPWILIFKSRFFGTWDQIEDDSPIFRVWRHFI